MITRLFADFGRLAALPMAIIACHDPPEWFPTGTTSGCHPRKDAEQSESLWVLFPFVKTSDRRVSHCRRFHRCGVICLASAALANSGSSPVPIRSLVPSGVFVTSGIAVIAGEMPSRTLTTENNAAIPKRP